MEEKDGRSEAEAEGWAENAMGKVPRREAESAAGEPSLLAAYYEALQRRYACVASGSVAVDAQYLEACLRDRGRAQRLERFLEALPGQAVGCREAFRDREEADGRQTDCYRQTWLIRGDGSVQSSIYILTRSSLEEVSSAEREA